MCDIIQPVELEIEWKETIYGYSDQIGEYRVIKWLGDGSSSNVYFVEKKGKFFAMKVVKQEYSNSSEYELNNIKLLSGQPHFITFYESFFFDNQCCMVMEKLDGNLLELIEGGTELDVKDIVRQLLQAICILDQHRLCHLDLKPENIGYVIHENILTFKILDFGLMVSYDEIIMMGGTPSYTDPNLFTDGEKSVNYQYDMWSMGMLMHEMITKHQLFPRLSYSRSNESNRTSIYEELEFLSIEDYKEVVDYKPFYQLLQEILHERITSYEALSHEWLKN